MRLSSAVRLPSRTSSPPSEKPTMQAAKRILGTSQSTDQETLATLFTTIRSTRNLARASIGSLPTTNTICRQCPRPRHQGRCLGRPSIVSRRRRKTRTWALFRLLGLQSQNPRSNILGLPSDRNSVRATSSLQVHSALLQRWSMLSPSRSILVVRRQRTRNPRTWLALRNLIKRVLKR